jgi:tRNA wybutosine-synthesizing protein 1
VVELPAIGSPEATTSSCDCADQKPDSATNGHNCCQKTKEAAVAKTPEASRSPSYDDGSDYDSEDDEENKEPEVIDLEDMGDSILASTDRNDTSAREMVTPSQAVALRKEGYKLIGSHSAVKLCRWTKHQLRGRGGCYKHTFYGITSYQCMEATPSLACANKCVFCWRHHKNPVGKEWRWKTDDPYYIVKEAISKHIQMIKETKGIPGVQMDRWREAHTVRHCALSLVGEPIMYPRIDELLGELHRRKISTFLVTNGQHPSAINNIRPITQLYVSVDAPTRDTLIEIDRPLFSDAWERLRESLTALKTKGQRTVARLTVVKGWNSDEVSGYAELIALGRVSLVEMKGVTYCGKSDASSLNMTNTPFHHEVVALARDLKAELGKFRAEQQRYLQEQSRLGAATMQQAMELIPEYDFACEHQHSCSVLVARVDQFAVDDVATGRRRWRTWIDYDKFHELAMRNAADPTFSFGVQDYTADTPDWALFGADEAGFDPTEMRHRKDNKQPKYTRFDDRGVPTHDHKDEELARDERDRLNTLMDERLRFLGGSGASIVTQSRDGGKEIADASLMFRGLVVSKG